MLQLLNNLLRFRWLLGILLLAVLPYSLHAAWRAWISNSNNVADWIPVDEQLQRFVELFGSDELIMISWEGCTFDDPRLSAYAQELTQANSDGVIYYRYVTTSPQILDFFMDKPLAMSREESLERMQGWMVSDNQETACLVALVSAEGAANRHAAIDFAYDTISKVDGLSTDIVRMAGPTIEGVAIDNASQAGLLELNLISYGICLGVMILCLRNLRAALLVLSLALFNEQMSLALIHWLGAQLDSILLLTANLTFVLTISIGIHLVNYYREALKATGPTEAPARALYVAMRPTLVATATTALGLASLGISEVKPLARFGLFSALSILVATVVVMLYTTIHFYIWPLRRFPKESQAQRQNENSRLVLWLQRMQKPILLLVGLLFVVGTVGVQDMQTAVGLREMVSPKTRSSQDFVWIEEQIGPLVPVELVLELPTGDARVLLDQFRFIHSLHKELDELSPSNIVLSMVTFSPEPPPPGGGFRQRVRTAAFRRTLLDNRERLGDIGFLQVKEESTFWRLSMRVPSMQDVNYGEVLTQAREVVDHALRDHQAIKPQSVLVCGGLPLIHRVQQQLLEDLIHSFILAFALVSFTLMILFRSVFCGLLCMIPNVLPSVIVFGTMGWLHWPVEVGAILTASAALGIAVDDSLHFITWFQRKLKSGGSIPEAVGHAYHHCGAAMIQTSLICSLGLVVFAASHFSPIARFGWCMFALLLLALLADLVVLPTLLLSPLGRPFLPKSYAADKSLRDFAFRVAGPRDLVINVLINVGLAAWIFRDLDQLSWTGLSSLWIFLGPMCFFLPLITTCFGYCNGVLERASGRVEPAWNDGTRWFPTALRHGFIRGTLTFCVCTAGLFAAQFSTSTPSISKGMALVVIGVVAGGLGYWFHLTAVIAAERLDEHSRIFPENE